MISRYVDNPVLARISLAFPLITVLFGALFLFVYSHRGFEDLRSVPSPLCGAVSFGILDETETRSLTCSFLIDDLLDDISRASADSAPVALLISKYRDRVSVFVNGAFVGKSDSNFFRALPRFVTLPAVIPIPASALLHSGNRVELVLHANEGRNPFFAKVYIGDTAPVIANFKRLWFFSAIAPTLVMGAQAALVVFFFTIWCRLRDEIGFGWLSLMLVLDLLRGSPIVQPFLGVDLTLAYSGLFNLFSSAAYVMFVWRLVGLPPAGWIKRVWLAPILVSLSAMLASPAFTTDVLWYIGVLVVLGNLMLASIILVKAARQNQLDARSLLLCTGFLILGIVHDILLLQNFIGGEMAIARPMCVFVLIAMIVLVINRYANAMEKIERNAQEMHRQKDVIAADLELAYANIRVARERAVVAQERARLMRDIHDGLGGEMIAVLALAEKEAGHSKDIARHARAALVDMRMIVASLQDYGGEFSMALGTWKERAEPQVRAAGLKLIWSTDDIRSDVGMGPKKILDTLRILQEALVNIIRHADASVVELRVETTDRHLLLILEDDGVGLKAEMREGKGILNMRSRAATLGGQLEIRSSERGTSVRLSLPHRGTAASGRPE